MEKLRKGKWSPEEDEKLGVHIMKCGHGCWTSLPKQAGLQRCGKSCKLRWDNYLRPDLKKGTFSQEEQNLIIMLHSLLGNKWSLIAGRLPGRTETDIKNLWNSCLKKKLRQRGVDPATHRPLSEVENGDREIITLVPGNREMIVNGGKDIGSSLGNKRKWSEVWDEMTNYRDEYGNEKANCNHCKKTFDGSSKKGTTHLRNHLERCRAKKKGGDGDKDKSIKTRDLASTPVVMKEKSVIDLLKHSFDTEGKTTEHWNPSVFNSRKVEILQVYQEEIEKLCGFLNKLSCRFSLVINWVGDYDACSLTEGLFIVHYIDDGWEQQSKIISLECANHENTVGTTKQSWLDWKIVRNICSIVSVNGNDFGEIDSWFSQQVSLPFGGYLCQVGELLKIIHNCTINWEGDIMDGIRQSVDYVYKTSSNRHKLLSAVNNAKSMGKKLIFDYAPIPPIGPFKYLEISLGLKEAFYELEKIDPDFRSINVLTNERWDEAAATFEHLKELKEFSSHLFGMEYITPIEDFHMLTCLHKKLARCNRSDYCHVCKGESLQIKKFVDIIWSKQYLILVIAIILDPRFKMDAVQLWYYDIYGSDADGYFEKIIKDFRDVYDEYANDSNDTGFDDPKSSKSYEILDDFGKPHASSNDNIGLSKSELDLYLKDLKVPAVEEFDILAWWRGNAPFYPTLARMARDYLAIPIFRTTKNDSTLIEEIHNILRSEVDDDIVPALICLKGLL